MISKEAFCRIMDAYQKFVKEYGKILDVIELPCDNFIDVFTAEVIESLVTELEGDDIVESVIWDKIMDADTKECPGFSSEELYDSLIKKSEEKKKWSIKYYVCDCGSYVNKNQPYCEKCGRALKWEADDAEIG